MDNHSIYRDLIAMLRSRFLSDRVLVFRGESELQRLSSWVLRDEDIGRALVDIADLNRMIETCNRCADVGERKFGVGSGLNRVMIILNSPQLVDALERRIHKQESVFLLKRMLQAADITFSECYITNLVKCDVRDSLMKPSQVVKNCESIITAEIEIMKPRIAVVFGDILPLQGIIQETRDINWFNIEHPITLIKNPDLKRPAWTTLKLVIARMKELKLQ